MRLSEKTIELTFCSQYGRLCGFDMIWFGLTQKQEARAGFDVCTRLGGRLILLQFKASNYVLRNGYRRFILQHHQLTALQQRCQHHYRSVFYVFPLIGNTHEIQRNTNLVSQTMLLDVARLPIIPYPTTRAGNPRQSGYHYADVYLNSVTIHSDPIEMELISALNFAKQGFVGADGINWIFENNFEEFWVFTKLFTRSAVGLIIPTPNDIT